MVALVRHGHRVKVMKEQTRQKSEPTTLNWIQAYTARRNRNTEIKQTSGR